MTELENVLFSAFFEAIIHVEFESFKLTSLFGSNDKKLKR